MSKRRATTSLRDDDIEEAPEEIGVFQKANDEVLRSRVIKSGKRHLSGLSDGTTRASPFSGFAGFGKTETSSSGVSPFSFLSQKPKAESAGDGDSDPSKSSKLTSSEVSQSASKPGLAAGSSIFSSLQPKSTNSSLNFSFTPADKSPKLSDAAAAAAAAAAAKALDNNLTSKGDAGGKDGDGKSQNLENLKELNLSCNRWITEHLEKNPYCILTPIFRDYEKHLAQLDIETESEERKTTKKENAFQIPLPGANESAKSFLFGKELAEAPKDDKASDFKLDKGPGLMKKPGESIFGEAKNAFPITTMFQPPAKTTINLNVGGNKQSEGDEAEEEESSEPPKSDFLPVVEEGSVYDKRCKIFVKKDSSFVSKGVGTLFLKPVKNTQKTQLIVRADTSSGNILLNIILTSSMPVQKTGKNNAMIVCVPNPETDPSPVPVLIRVKTSEDCDELVRKLEEFKGSNA